MKQDMLHVRMLGEFSLSRGEIRIDDSANRSRKVWLLLAYLIFHRGRIVPQEELVDVLWGGEKNDNPGGALKTTLWRVRQSLEPFGADMGHQCIISKGGGYRWNPDVPTTVDAEVFETLCREGSAAREEGVRLEKFKKALALYQGNFLNRLSSEFWVEPLTAYYHNLFINTTLETLPLLDAGACAREAAALCRNALRVEPYQENLYQHLMLSLLELGEYQKAAGVYEEMRDLLFTNLGIMPAEESQAIYQEVLRNINSRALPLSTIREQLREQTPAAGALVCDYAFFKLFYQAEARSSARRGDAVHVAVLSVTGKEERELPQRSLDRAMENLRAHIQSGLRRGDIASRCSASQYILLLLQANYENSKMVCERIIKTFARAYPHSPARIHFSLLPLEPLSEVVGQE